MMKYTKWFAIIIIFISCSATPKTADDNSFNQNNQTDRNQEFMDKVKSENIIKTQSPLIDVIKSNPQVFH
ncbi:hypothetical protein [Chryseobacterium viscerum]|uniref:Uncharacterized protein n=1 Tax=Chryseobacterium viscerum TaxID=1037377 RepID=A0A316W9J9_9FLAO|nr:hypothetical protein [Chryseobacterium viscerum]PWN57994.1 hypothetical protein C1634_024960 [Chryseobacterium viscerum]